MSRVEIRQKAEEFRNMLNIPINQLYVDITRVLERLNLIIPNVTIEIIPDDKLGVDVQAQTDVEKNIIYIKESVYNGAAENNG